jgi:hypothetical protein
VAPAAPVAPAVPVVPAAPVVPALPVGPPSLVAGDDEQAHDMKASEIQRCRVMAATLLEK